jgi:hypothetical protein
MKCCWRLLTTQREVIRIQSLNSRILSSCHFHHIISVTHSLPNFIPLTRYSTSFSSSFLHTLTAKYFTNSKQNLRASSQSTQSIMDPKEGQTEQKKPFENRLAKEKSPYLLQHKNNPVDW